MVQRFEFDPVIRSFYSERFCEDDRLARSLHGRLEFLRTQELLRRLLPPAPARVLDVGGATGAHARWLAADGYDVHLIDPVPEHVEQARRQGGFTAAVGDARSLPAEDRSADATLLMGPLYHLIDVEDRLLTLREARRVTRPGGLVAGAVISRYAGLLELGGLGLLGPDNDAEFLDALRTGIHHDDPNGFTNAYFHRAAEVEAEFRTVGFTGVSVIGVEGPNAPALDNASSEKAEAVLASAMHCARLLESDPAIMETSPHLLAIGYDASRSGNDWS